MISSVFYLTCLVGLPGINFRHVGNGADQTEIDGKEGFKRLQPDGTVSNK